jgi:fructose-1,6-bisphosphatase I
VYGPSTLLVLTVGDGVHASRWIAKWAVSSDPSGHAHPGGHREFAINASNSASGNRPVQRYVERVEGRREGPRGRDFNMRWVASMVADVHRILTRGGIFMYPHATPR